MRRLLAAALAVAYATGTAAADDLDQAFASEGCTEYLGKMAAEANAGSTERMDYLESVQKTVEPGLANKPGVMIALYARLCAMNEGAPMSRVMDMASSVFREKN